MASLISTLTSVVGFGISSLTSVVGAITAEGNELLLLACTIGFVGTGVGMLKRIVS